MINKNSLKAYLRYFDQTQRQRGKALYKNGAVLNCDHDEKEKVFTAEVVGGSLYTVHLKYKSSTQIASGICSCPFRIFCKHQVALIEFIMKEPLHSANNRLKLEGRSGEMRKIQLTDLAQLEEWIWDKPSYHRPWKAGYYVYEWVDPVTIYSFERRQRNYSYVFEEDVMISGPAVVIKFAKGEIAIQCNNCDLPSTHVCDHQTDVLTGLVKIECFHQVFQGEVSFEEVLSQFAEQYGMSRAFLKKYGRIFINDPSFQLVPRDPGVLIGDDWDDFLLSVDSITSSISTSDSIFLAQQESVYNDHFGNALVWSADRTKGQFFFPRIIEGKLTRDHSKLASHIKETDTLEFVSNTQLDFYGEYDKLITCNRILDMPVLLEKVYNFLHKNADTFFSFVHYNYKPDDSYYHYRNDGIRKKDLTRFTFNPEKAGLRFEINAHEDHYVLKTFITIDSALIPLSDIDLCHSLFVLIKRKAYLYKTASVFFYLSSYEENCELIFDHSANINLAEIMYKLSQKFEVGPLPDALRVKTTELVGGQKKLRVSESGRILAFEALLSYQDSGDFNILDARQKFEISDDTTYVFEPHEKELNEFKTFMDHSHPSFKECSTEYSFYHLPIEEAIRDSWFLDFFENCKKQRIQVFGEDLLKNFEFNKNKAVITNSVKSGIDWFDLSVEMSFGREKVSTAKWVEAVRNKEKYVRLTDGTLGILPQQWLLRLQKLVRLSEIRGGDIKISKLRFNVLEELFEDLEQDDFAREVHEKKERLREFEAIKKHSLPRTVKAKLRDYQKKGFQWLKFLDEFQFGGCLADDMGLGKTLQVIAFLADQKKQKKGTSLVVVPRSLLFNWEVEINKFCPSLTYLIYHGPGRRFDQKVFSEKDVLISTYDTVTIDIDLFRQFRFNYCILDESQAIKNPNSKRYKAMRLINSTNKLVMSGTPIENNTFDLYSQFSFINPGLLSSKSSFKNEFSTPIDTRGDQEAADLLRKIIYPFLLRRTKEQVAKDLPEKTENVLMCVMGSRQQKYYDELKLAIWSDIKKKIDAEGINKSRFRILEGLLRLRQFCNAPYLVNNELIPENIPSAKLDLLLSHIDEVTQSHKVLVFSQFVTMLALIKSELERRAINYAYLDGSTKNRQGSVNHFQNDEKCRVFLVSLKAGNTGLNLTSAEYVYIVDPWWNPAAEAQAIDRTHRIGQDNHVFAYKLICKGTIEEKILTLQEKKKKIASDIIRTDENILKSLTRETLVGLFE